ncbi:MAG TPA: nucleotidyl transferase AbiEii/AbiGii toxin family protein [Polyangiaceae bacterium]|nr:nucleotidyl transferase AbiEii/AbiGii toxin family protein [Polyangiaceae bacterium]
MTGRDPTAALRRIASELAALGVRFAVVGGFGVSLRAEVRFTRDVDVAVVASDDPAVEALVRELRTKGYSIVALVEHDDAKRIATVRLRSPSGITVDLLTASSGIEGEIVERATDIVIEGVGSVPVAKAEELLAMKVLSMDARRLQDRIDAIRLVQLNASLDLDRVREDLRLIDARGFSRGQELLAKLDDVLAAARA